MKILGIFIPFAALVLLFFAVLPNEEERQQIRIARVLEERVQLSQELEPLLRAGQFPEYIDTVVSGRRVSGRPHLTIEPHLQAEAEKIFRSYKPDFGAVVMLDAKTGAILAIASWQKDKAVDGH
ncbi:MAG: hypothetical protein N2578_09795, partial [Bdellovibrionaceae bacterium]|nr:hypothetical protein [Pseudobdellovibrionaceae bacterium]